MLWGGGPGGTSGWGASCGRNRRGRGTLGGILAAKGASFLRRDVPRARTSSGRAVAAAPPRPAPWPRPAPALPPSLTFASA